MKKLLLLTLLCFPAYGATLDEAKLKPGDSVTVSCPVVNPVPVPTPTPVGSWTDFYKQWDHATTWLDKDGKPQGNSAVEVSQAQLIAGYQSPYFVQDPTSLTLTVYDNKNGAFTSTAHFCRWEFRSFDFKYTDHATNTIKFAVIELPDGQKVVVHQIHEPTYPLVKIEVIRKGNTLSEVALVKVDDAGGDKDTSFPLIGTFNLRDQVSETLEYIPNPQTLNITVNGKTTSIKIKRAAKSAYFKAGAYFQDNSGKGERVVVKEYLP